MKKAATATSREMEDSSRFFLAPGNLNLSSLEPEPPGVEEREPEGVEERADGGTSTVFCRGSRSRVSFSPIEACRNHGSEIFRLLTPCHVYS